MKRGSSDEQSWQERVILVDERDGELGSEVKLLAHVEGRLHRAFSIFVFDGAGNMLLQRRTPSKYHSGGLWSNTCCGHPRPGEPTEAAAHRRLREEMGFDRPLERVFGFTYRAEFGNGLFEHEYVHVFVGEFRGTPVPDPGEVSEWRWADLREVLAHGEEEPEERTVWFGIAMRELRLRGLLDRGSPKTPCDRVRSARESNEN
jgi:isopentenyl-diphosphate delta-isomerase